jgi:hypothetical protein
MPSLASSTSYIVVLEDVRQQLMNGWVVID